MQVGSSERKGLLHQSSDCAIGREPRRCQDTLYRLEHRAGNSQVLQFLDAQILQLGKELELLAFVTHKLGDDTLQQFLPRGNRPSLAKTMTFSNVQIHTKNSLLKKPPRSLFLPNHNKNSRYCTTGVFFISIDPTRSPLTTPPQKQVSSSPVLDHS